LPQIDGNIAAAQIRIAAAERDLNRLRTLYRQEAVPLRRVQDAETALRIARSELAASGRQRRTLTNPDTIIALTAPISGRILMSKFVRGGAVEQGAELMRIGNPSSIWLVARVPEALAAKVANPTGIDVTIDGKTQALMGGTGARLVQAGTYVDPVSRTMEVIFAVAGGPYKPGTRLPGRLRLGGGVSGLAVPASAVIDEGGQTVVYVQVAGETFERRIVSVGQRSGDFVGITGDVKPDERVVTVGAAAVRAAAATPDAFGHGHAH
jgi:membrane fusion protein, heavy metal efflux system